MEIKPVFISRPMKMLDFLLVGAGSYFLLQFIVIGITFFCLIYITRNWKRKGGVTSRQGWYRGVYLKSTHWREYRRKRLAFSHYQCEAMGCKAGGGNLDVHHLTYKHLWREKMSDTIVFCRYHHEMAEQKKTIRLTGNRVLKGRYFV